MKENCKRVLYRIPGVSAITRFAAHALGEKLGNNTFSTSSNYWESRYQEGGNSGHGSYGELAQYKADFLNSFVQENHVESAIEFGSSDGN